jgi:hypothetical protein
VLELVLSLLQAAGLAAQLSSTREDLASSQMLSGQQALQLHQQEQQLAAAAQQKADLQQQLQEGLQQVRSWRCAVSMHNLSGVGGESVWVLCAQRPSCTSGVALRKLNHPM